MPSNPDLKQIKKWENLDSIRTPVLNNMARYRDHLIQKYDEDIKESKNELDIAKIKFSLAKILLVSHQDDPGNKRKLKFLAIKKDLQNIPEWGEKINNWYENYKKK